MNPKTTKSNLTLKLADTGYGLLEKKALPLESTPKVSVPTHMSSSKSNLKLRRRNYWLSIYEFLLANIIDLLLVGLLFVTSIYMSQYFENSRVDHYFLLDFSAVMREMSFFSVVWFALVFLLYRFLFYVFRADTVGKQVVKFLAY